MAVLINERSHQPLATTVELADTRRSRRKGLLGRDSMSADEAIVLSPCMAVHTAFMRFAIDVVFVDGEGQAVSIIHAMQPWRMAASVRARAVIEMPAGRARACDLKIGDRLLLSR